MKLLPERRPITSFGNGGFRFGDHSHQGHLIILPTGMRAWDGEDYAAVIAEQRGFETLLIGTGAIHQRLTPVLAKLQSHGISVDCMTTSSAIHTYNFMLAENRLVAAALMTVP